MEEYMDLTDEQVVEEAKKLLLGYKHCEYCGEWKHGVEYTINPFLQEIHGEQEWLWLCEDCVNELLMDI
jgi:hypothetical protein